MKLFDKASFWEQYKIYRDIIFILRKKEIRWTPLTKEPGFENYCREEFRYFEEVFRYDFENIEAKKPEDINAALLTEIIKLLDQFRCHRLMQFVYPGYAETITGDCFRGKDREPNSLLVKAWLENKGDPFILTLINRIRRKVPTRNEIIDMAVEICRWWNNRYQGQNEREINYKYALLTGIPDRDEPENCEMTGKCEATSDDENLPDNLKDYLERGSENPGTGNESRSDSQGEPSDLSDIRKTQEMLSAYMRIMQRKRGLSNVSELLRRNVYSKVDFDEDEKAETLSIAKEDIPAANILRKIILYRKLGETYSESGNVLDTSRYVAMLVGDNNNTIFKAMTRKKGGKVVFLADASASMTRYYELERKVYTILSYALKDYVDFELFCFDYYNGTVRIKRRFYEGDLTPITHAANYVFNRLRLESHRYHASVIVLFTDMLENIAKEGRFFSGLNALAGKARKTRIKLVGAIPGQALKQYLCSKYIRQFQRFFPVIYIASESSDRLIMDLIKLLKAVKMI